MSLLDAPMYIIYVDIDVDIDVYIGASSRLIQEWNKIGPFNSAVE